MPKTVKINDALHAKAKVRAAKENTKLETIVEDGVKMRLAVKRPARIAESEEVR